MRWDHMTAEQRRVTLHAMCRFGGSFVSRLGEAWQVADAENALRLGAAFSGLLAQYGPGSDAFARAQHVENA